MSTQVQILNISEYRNKLINQTILFFSFLSLPIVILVTIRGFLFDSPRTLYINWIIITILWILAYFRKRISILIKVTFLLSLIMIALISGLSSFGFLAAAKLYIITLPLFVSFLVSPRFANFSFISFLFIYILFAILITSGIVIPSIDATEYAKSYVAWTSEVAVLIMCCWGLLYIGRNYQTTLSESFHKLNIHQNHLEQLVIEKTKGLNDAISKLKSINNELAEKNEIIENQNLQLKVSMDNLKAAQSNLIQSEKMASLGILTAGVAHEINNPLNYIMGGHSSLKQYLKQKNIKDTDVEQALEYIDIGMKRSMKIVKDLDQFSAQQDSFNEICKIDDIIDNCLLVLNNKLENQILVVKHYDTNDMSIQGNISKIHQVFLSILNNATQAISVDGKITITAKIIDNYLQIEVFDNGVGIQKHHLKKIMDPFFTTREPGEGTGLGLFITQSIVKEHKGKIEIDSKLNKGTTVLISLFKNDQDITSTLSNLNQSTTAKA